MFLCTQVSWVWTSSACVDPDSVQISALTVHTVQYGTVAVTWQPPPGSGSVPPLGASGYEYSLDGSAEWLAVHDTILLLDVLPLGAPHSIAVRAAGPGACAGPYPASTVSWVQPEPPPGKRFRC